MTFSKNVFKTITPIWLYAYYNNWPLNRVNHVFIIIINIDFFIVFTGVGNITDISISNKHTTFFHNVVFYIQFITDFIRP